MSSLQKLKNASSLKQFAALLDIKPQFLSFALYISAQPKYSTFSLIKKSGGLRQIDAPNERLKGIQRRLADLLYDCRDEIEKDSNRGQLSHGFRRGQSIATNAFSHTNRRYVLNVDIENFFPSINFGRVRGFFIKSNDFNLHHSAATIIAQIACTDTAPAFPLPQGSPCSPIISDLVAQIMDLRLVRLARSVGCTYSRYADDLTFSTNRKEFPSELATLPEHLSTWVAGTTLSATVSNAGFQLNQAKTRMQYGTSRQTVTGLTVNRKVNIPAPYYRNARAMCFSLFQTGKYHQPESKEEVTSRLHRLEGRLNHVDYIKGTADNRDPKDKKESPTASRKLYRDFLFFKNFVCAKKPLILCEGKTDPVYLKAAIQKLAANYPTLIEEVAGHPKLKVSFFKYGKRSLEVQELGGGTGDLKKLIAGFEHKMGRFKFRPLKYPVLILLDNDSGSTGIFSLLSKMYKLNVSLVSNGQFYFVCHNLYVVKTPELPPGGTSMIENLFDDDLLKSTFKGKTFSKSNDTLKDDQFGKSAFSDFVRANANTINFAGFGVLLDRIAAVLAHYKPPAETGN